MPAPTTTACRPIDVRHAQQADDRIFRLYASLFLLDFMTRRRFAPDSPLEEAGFELSVPPERKAVPSAIARSFGNPPTSLAAVGDPR
jgi:hypothetical protein